MTSSHTYSQNEIRKILKKASEIQTRKDLYGDKEGLTEEELVELAREVGIDRSSLIAALQDVEMNKLSNQYEWFKGTSRIQSVTSVEGEFDEKQWEELVREIRKVTGGIGKVTQNNTSFEWEQRKSDIGYKHLSLTPKDGKTKLQMVTSWNTLRTMAGFAGAFFGAILILVFFKEAFSKQIALMFTPFGGLAGFFLSRIFLKSYYDKQKKELNTLIQSLSGKITSFRKGAINIEETDVYEKNSQTPVSERTSS